MSELTGRELDAAIAERCFGRAVNTEDDGSLWMFNREEETEIGTVVIEDPLPRYHENMGDAWQVAEWICGHGIGDFVLVYDGRWECSYGIWLGDSIQACDGYADTAPEAICRAALALAERLKMAEQEATDATE